MMTQLPSVFELMVGTRGRQQSTSGAPPSSTAAAAQQGGPVPPGKDEPSSPSSIPRISSATSLPSVISSNNNTFAAARKTSVISIPEYSTSPVHHQISSYRRRTEPNLQAPTIAAPHHHQHGGIQGAGGPHYPSSHPSAAAAAAAAAAAGGPHHQHQHQPPSSYQHHLAPPSFHPTYHSNHNSPINPQPPYSASSAAGYAPTDYFSRQRTSISSSIDSLTRTNSSNGPLSIPTTSNPIGYSPKHEFPPSQPAASQQQQQQPAPQHQQQAQPPQQQQPPPQQIQSMQAGAGGPAGPGRPIVAPQVMPTYGEYYPVIYSNVPQSQVIYTPLYQPQYAHPGLIHQHPQAGQLPPHYQQHGMHHILPQPHDENNALINKRRIIKRRTRSGCLTCRKRRIKCDERKPHCFNCERSKKICLGYENVPKKKPGQNDSDSDEKEEHSHSHSHDHHGENGGEHSTNNNSNYSIN